MVIYHITENDANKLVFFHVAGTRFRNVFILGALKIVSRRNIDYG